jgi:hypothetical protein
LRPVGNKLGLNQSFFFFSGSMLNRYDFFVVEAKSENKLIPIFWTCSSSLESCKSAEIQKSDTIFMLNEKLKSNNTFSDERSKMFKSYFYWFSQYGAKKFYNLYKKLPDEIIVTRYFWELPAFPIKSSINSVDLKTTGKKEIVWRDVKLK